MNVTILHLSDLHLSISDKAEERNKILNSLIRDIADRFDKLKLTSPYIALTGDLANFGIKSEFELAKGFISKLEQALTQKGLKPLGIILCPGNHDVNRKAKNLPANKQLMEDLVKRKDSLDEEEKVLQRVKEWLGDSAGRTALRKRMKDYYDFSKNYHKLNKNDNFLHYTQSYIDDKLTINFVSLNSAYLYSEDVNAPDQKGGFIGDLQIQQAFASLPKNTPDSRSFNIALVHYPFEEIIRTGRENDETRLNGWADLVLTSHRHKSLIRVIEDVQEDGTKQRKRAPLVICRSKCIFDRDKSAGAVAGYHIINLTFSSGELSGFNVWEINYQSPNEQNDEPEWIEDKENYPKKVPLNLEEDRVSNKKTNIISLEEFRKLTESQKNREIANICAEKTSIIRERIVDQKYIPSLYVEREESAIIEEFLSSEKRAIAFVGPAGTGKTNFMCHTAQSLSQANFVMFYSGVNLPGSLKKSILEDLKDITSDLDFDSALELLAKALEFKQSQLLIFIDGLNEISYGREVVRVELDEIAHLIQEHPIRLIVSCRNMDWDYWLRNNNKQKGCFGRSIYDKPMGSSVGAINISKFSNGEFSVAWRKYKQVYRIKGRLSRPIIELCKEPFMLRIFAETYKEGKKLPRFIEPFDLFQRYFEEKFVSRVLIEQVWSFFAWLTKNVLETEVPYLPYSEIRPDDRSICDMIIDENILYIEDGLLKFHFEQIFEYIVSRIILTNSRILGARDKNEFLRILLKNSLVNIPGILENIVLSCKTDNVALVSSLKELLRDKERGQEICCGIITKLSDPPIEIDEIALELAGNDSYYIRTMIAQSLGYYIKNNGWNLIVKMSTGDLWTTRETAAYIIGHEARVWNKQTRKLLYSLMSDLHWRVRRAAGYSVKTILLHEKRTYGKKARTILKEMGKPSWEAKYSFCIAFQGVDLDKASFVSFFITDLVRDDNRQVRWTLAHYLPNYLGGKKFQLFEILLKDKDAWIRKEAAIALVEMMMKGDRISERLLKKVINDSDKTVRVAIARRSENILKIKWVRHSLERYATCDDLDVQVAATYTLEKMISRLKKENQGIAQATDQLYQLRERIARRDIDPDISNVTGLGKYISQRFEFKNVDDKYTGIIDTMSSLISNATNSISNSRLLQEEFLTLLSKDTDESVRWALVVFLTKNENSIYSQGFRLALLKQLSNDSHWWVRREVATAARNFKFSAEKVEAEQLLKQLIESERNKNEDCKDEVQYFATQSLAILTNNKNENNKNST